MIDFAAARRTMVDGQVRPSDVTDPRLLAALLEVPRERFVPAARAAMAYLDLDVPVGDGSGGRRMIKPMVLAKLVQMAEIGESDRVLDVGCATGYSSALLALLGGSVVALEEDAVLARQAREMLGAAKVSVVTGSLAGGWPSGGPYDAIMVEGATEVVPEALLRQLKEGGRLVCVLGRGPACKAMLYRMFQGEFSGRAMFDASAPALPGFARPPAFVF